MSKNSFTYEWMPYPLAFYRWEVLIDGYTLTGEAHSWRQMLRRVKRVIKHHNKMEKLING